MWPMVNSLSPQKTLATTDIYTNMPICSVMEDPNEEENEIHSQDGNKKIRERSHEPTTGGKSTVGKIENVL